MTQPLGTRLASGIAVKTGRLMPGRQMLNQSRVNVAVGLDKNGLVRVHVGTKVLAVPENVTILRRVALFNVVLGLLERRHHQVHLVALLQEGARSTNLGMHSVIPAVVAAAQADRVVLGAEVVLDGGARRGVEEQIDAYAVGGPDHGLDVESGPAVCRHADQLASHVSSSH